MSKIIEIICSKMPEYEGLPLLQELAKSEDINKPDETNRLAVHAAISVNKIKYLEFLISLKPQLEAKDATKRTPAEIAAISGNLLALKMLHGAGASITGNIMVKNSPWSLLDFIYTEISGGITPEKSDKLKEIYRYLCQQGVRHKGIAITLPGNKCFEEKVSESNGPIMFSKPEHIPGTGVMSGTCLATNIQFKKNQPEKKPDDSEPGVPKFKRGFLRNGL
jgi:hypothetical protein